MHSDDGRSRSFTRNLKASYPACRGWRRTFALVGLVRKLPVLDQRDGLAISPEQAAALEPLLQPLATHQELTSEQAEAKAELLRAALAATQQDAPAKVESS